MKSHKLLNTAAVCVLLSFSAVSCAKSAKSQDTATIDHLKQSFCRAVGGMARDAMLQYLNGTEEPETIAALEDKFLPTFRTDYGKNVFSGQIKRVVGMTYRFPKLNELPESEYPKFTHDYGTVHYQRCMETVVAK